MMCRSNWNTPMNVLRSFGDNFSRNFIFCSVKNDRGIASNSTLQCIISKIKENNISFSICWKSSHSEVFYTFFCWLKKWYELWMTVRRWNEFCVLSDKFINSKNSNSKNGGCYYDFYECESRKCGMNVRLHVRYIVISLLDFIVILFTISSIKLFIILVYVR